MTDLRKRGPDGTLRRRIFVVLRDDASSTAHRLAELMGVGYHTTRKACGYLVARRLAIRHTVSRRIVLYAAVPGRQPPEDRRGKPKSCRNFRGAHAWAGWLRMMRAKHGPGWRYQPRAHPLDAWAEPARSRHDRVAA